MRFSKFGRFVAALVVLFASPLGVFRGMAHPLLFDDPPHGGDIPLDLKSASDYASVVYIDPGTASPGDGSSPDAPLHSWGDVVFHADTAYVQKRGTTDSISGALVVPDNVLLGAYGPESDPRPVIYDASDDITYMVQVTGDFVTVRDLEIVSPRAASGIHFAAGYWPTDGVVWNCSIHGVDAANYLMWGVRVFSARTKVLNSEIYYTGDDGIFVQYFTDVEIGYNEIHNVNQKWFEDTSESHAGGDGIQFDSHDRFYIHHNVVDRTDTGNKFCFIVDPKNDSAAGGVVEDNVCRTGHGVTGLFAGGAKPYHIVARNNVFEYVDTDGGGVGIYSHSIQPDYYNNVIVGFGRGITLLNSSGNATADHNVFYDIGDDAVWGSIASIQARNNIFAIDASADALSIGNLTASHNLFSEADNVVGDDAIIGDPLFVDTAGHDFRLRSGSPAIDAGIAVAGIDTDAAGNPHVGEPDVGAYEFQPELILRGTPGSRTIHLNWILNADLPAAGTWRISYEAPLTAYLPVDITEFSARAYTLTDLTNYVWYTVTLEAMVDGSPVLSDTVRMMPTDLRVYLPLVLQGD